MLFNLSSLLFNFCFSFLVFVPISIFLNLVILIFQKVQILNLHVNSLSLMSKTLLAHNINNSVRTSKLVDDFAISVDADSALSTSLSTEEILFLMQLALFLLLSGYLGYLVWHYLKISSLCVKAVAGVNSFFLSFFNWEGRLFTFYDSYKNFYTLNYNSQTKTFHFYIKPFNSDTTYKFEEFTGVRSEVLNGIKPDILEKISTCTQTETFIGQSTAFTPEKLTNLTSDTVVKTTDICIKTLDLEKTYQFYDFTGVGGQLYTLKSYCLNKVARATQTETINIWVPLTPEDVRDLTDDFIASIDITPEQIIRNLIGDSINQAVVNTPVTLLESISSASSVV